MATPSDASTAIRQIQWWAVVLSCLPANGKARELFSLALSLDDGPWLERIMPPIDPDSDEDMREWLEYLWVRGNLSPDEQDLVDWQANSDNMSAAIAEYLAVVGKLPSRLTDSPPTVGIQRGRSTCCSTCNAGPAEGSTGGLPAGSPASGAGEG
jgi:hypothetical protein